MTANRYKKRVRNFTAKIENHVNDTVAKVEKYVIDVATNILKHKIVVSLFVIGVTLICAWLFGLFTTLSDAVIETLVNVNIALFGFFLAFAVYTYNSYESRINKLELSIKCYKEKSRYAANGINRAKFSALIRVCTSQTNGLRKRRAESSRLIILTAFVLLLSLALSLVFLGSMYADTSATRVVHFEPASLMGQVLLYTILSCLTFGIITIFILVLTISKKYIPTENTQDEDARAQQTLLTQYAIDTMVITTQPNPTTQERVSSNYEAQVSSCSLFRISRIFSF
jgi:hypothetical protein